MLIYLAPTTMQCTLVLTLAWSVTS